MAQTQWDSHAEKEFGRFTRELGKVLPAKLLETRRLGRRMKAMTGANHRRVKG